MSKDFINNIAGIGQLLAIGITGKSILAKNVIEKIEFENQRNKMIIENIASYANARSSITSIVNGLANGEKSLKIALDLQSELMECEKFLIKLIDPSSNEVSYKTRELHYDEITETLKKFFKEKSFYGRKYITPEIPSKTIEKAIKNLTFNEHKEEIVIIIDATLDYSYEFGAIFTRHGVYIKNDGLSPLQYVQYSDIVDLKVKGWILNHVLTITTKYKTKAVWSDFRLINSESMLSLFEELSRLALS